MMKKIMTFLLAVLMCFSVFTFASCSTASGGKTEEELLEENGGSLEGVDFNSKNGEMYAGTKEGKTKLKLSYSTGYKHGWIRQLSRAFLLDEAGKDYYIILDPDSELTTSVSSKLESGANLSDIYMPLASNWYSYASLGYLENLDDLYSQKVPGEEVTVGDKMLGSWKTYGKSIYQNEKHNFIFPWNENVTGIVYNKTMFDKYGWAVPVTYADLDALCKKIIADTKGKVAPFVYPGTVSGGYWDFVGTNWWLQASGVEGLNKFMEFESAEVYNPMKAPGDGKLSMLEAFEELIVANRTTYTLKGSASKDHLMSQVSFAQGQAAMIPNGSWIEKESGTAIKDEIRMMQVPMLANAKTDKDGKPIKINYTGQPDYMLIPSKADNKEGAKKFLAFTCKDELLLKYTSLTGAPRPFDYDISKAEVTPFVKSCIDIWSNSTSWFESSTSKFWTSGKASKFQTTNPYTTLLSKAGTITALGWCQSEYSAVSGTWQSWVDALA